MKEDGHYVLDVSEVGGRGRYCSDNGGGECATSETKILKGHKR